MSLMPYPAAKRRHIEHGDAILRFLSLEKWSTTTMLGELIGLKHPRTARTVLWKLVQYGYLRRRKLYQDRMTIWTITRDGMAEAGVDEPEFATGMLPTAHAFGHEMGLQQIHCAAARAGWSWQKPKRKGELAVVDGIAISPDGITVALEFCRTLPKPSSLGKMIAGRLLLRQQQNWNGIWYISATPALNRALQRMFARVVTIPFEGRDLLLNARHRSFFRFHEIGD